MEKSFFEQFKDEIECEHAKWFAIGAHGQQRRKYTNEPYWYHLRDVASILSMYARNVTGAMLCAAWLHDVVEDTEFNIYDIKDHFGLDVFEYVRRLTEPPHSFGNRAARKAFYNEQLAGGCEIVQTIKCADLIDNTASIEQYDPEFAKIYLAEKRILLPMLTKAEPEIYRIACEQVGLI